MSRAPEKSWWAEALAIARRHGRGGPSDAADDLAQDLAVATLERGEEPQRVGSWLERVGRNAAIDRWRSERRRGAPAPVEAGAAPVDPEALLLRRERRSVVRGALAALPRDQRRAALLRFHHDLPFAAVACRLGTEEITARTRVHRALARMRERLAALRAIWVGLPGVHAATLGLVLFATASGGEVPAALAPAPAIAPPPAAKRALEARAPRAATPAPPPAPAPEPSLPKAVQRYEFPPDEIDVQRQTPDLIFVQSDARAPQSSLIEIRRDLSPELLKSLEDL